MPKRLDNPLPHDKSMLSCYTKLPGKVAAIVAGSPLCRLLMWGLLPCGLLLCGPPALLAQTPLPMPAATDPAEPAKPAAPVATEIADEFTTPRKAYRAFLERMTGDEKKKAAELLNLSDLNAEAVKAKGPELAYKLYFVLSQLVTLPEGVKWPLTTDGAYAAIPNEPDADTPWIVGSLNRFVDYRATQIELTRDDQKRWRFSRDTVQRIEDLFAEVEIESERLAIAKAKSPAAPSQKGIPADPFRDAETPVAKTTKPFPIWFRELFPASLRTKALAWQLLPTYQWICLALIGVIGRVVERLSRSVLTRSSDGVLHRIDPDFDDTTRKVWRPVGRLVNAAVWYGGALAIGLPYEVVNILLVVLRVFTIFAAVWAAFAIIDLVAGYFSRRAKRRALKFDDLVLPLATSTAKVVAALAGVLVAIATLFDTLPSTLIGGLGIGGLAIALASQETLANFFGSITVLFDRPFEVGDWVLVEGIEGEVESVGFRSTRLRTGINSQVTLPNSKLAAASVDNWGRRKYRRYRSVLGVEYGTPPDRVEAFCEGIRELIRRQPHTRKDFYAAYFNDFGASSLDILVVVFFEVPDWPTELRERSRLLLDILRLAERLGVGFAFPTQTVHLFKGETPPHPVDLTHTERDGQRLAAEIAGELLNYQDRPGKVKFTGPTPIERKL
ncbi:mechanosensitive ion channel family protein [Botrimarina hoheduenensis]|uniref:Low conductance mechanosensitive channel YnaI n=1 Tax=Botrimarina hoheduenensis TaxID=2528000 RepID=A0A5C5VZA2_9BACT|nr:mechanosensitive ion channel family protein [Botrimarina hoheduenensis]TWT43325.1 Low conductance mechanosensitive channel YnaI [Botrimarina hoheduenensis]